VAKPPRDWCSWAPDWDWGDLACKPHDADYAGCARWKVHQKIAADVRLGWRIATTPKAPRWSQPVRRILYRSGHIAAGVAYTGATSLFGWYWWFTSKPLFRCGCDE